MRLLVYEHVSGGGFCNKPIPASVLSEGFGMLKTLVSDFKAAGHNVATTLDLRVAKLNPPIPSGSIAPVSSSKETQAKLLELSEQADAVYIIAPETDGVLKSIVELVKQTGAKSLNCSTGAIAKISDKADFYKDTRKIAPQPESILLSVAEDLKEIIETIRDRLNFPVVFKPVDGVSCGGISLVKTENQVARAIAKIRELTSDRFLVQQLIEGAAASVSLLSTGSKVVPVSLNHQEVKLETVEACSSYSGGTVPFDHPLRQKAFEAAEKLVKSSPGLRGYVGVDFVLTDEAAVAIEVNPRLTTSYVGLRRVVNFNLAQSIVDAVLKRELPTNVESCGCTYFSKVETPNPTISALQEMYALEDVVSPPFPVSGNNAASALIAVYGATPEKAKADFREAKKLVLNTISRGR
ncbi:ATP-grasp domain-containing protein [Candidatus Bathyarchaeota archaeon]|nr:ATP-grasp domain-containing protein [Candidatus Bathyarchaeota archaeon]